MTLWVLRRPIVVAPPPAPVVPAYRRYGRGALRWAVRVAGLVTLLTLALLAAAVVWSVPAPSAEARSTGFNAVRLGPTWVTDPHSDDEHDQLAARLQAAQISDVLVTVGPLDGEGLAAPGGTPRAEAFIAALHRSAPGMRVQAAIAERLPAGGGSLRLHDRPVKEEVVATARTYLDLGFDGIHYDLEPVRSGNRDVIDLLERTRQLTTARGAVLSVALEPLQASSVAASVLTAAVPTYAEPDPAYLSAVADQVDQLAIRTEGSALPTPSAFAAYVAWQTVRTAELVGDRVSLLVGIPTGDTDAWDRHPWAESPAAAVHGLRRGLDTLGSRRGGGQPIGAVVADWTTSEQEWRTFVDEWVQPPT